MKSHFQASIFSLRPLLTYFYYETRVQKYEPSCPPPPPKPPTRPPPVLYPFSLGSSVFSDLYPFSSGSSVFLSLIFLFGSGRLHSWTNKSGFVFCGNLGLSSYSSTSHKTGAGVVLQGRGANGRPLLFEP